MGTTIRRQPVNFDIPRAPDYKFLNITNFRGLDVSSNPFELANNTASDCLNVYVDETNTLTTRPRLEKKIATPLNGTHVGTYSLHDGYLLHYITDNGPEMWFLKDGQLNDDKVSGTIPTNKCKYFEQGDKVYLLDGERYMVIADNALTDVEGYVPTTAVVSLDGTKHDIGSINLLKDTYEERFDWDGKTTNHLPENVDDAINHYYTTKHKLPSGQVFERVYDDFSAIIRDGYTFYYVEDVRQDQLTKHNIGSTRSTSFQNVAWYVSKDFSQKTLVILDIYYDLMDVYKYSGGTVWSQTTYNDPTVNDGSGTTMSPQLWAGDYGLYGTDDASVVIITGYVTNRLSSKIYDLPIGESSYQYRSTETGVVTWSITSKNEAIAGWVDGAKWFKNITDKTGSGVTILSGLSELTTQRPCVGIIDSGQTAWFVGNDDALYVLNKNAQQEFSAQTIDKVLLPTRTIPTSVMFYDDGLFAWCVAADVEGLFMTTDVLKEPFKNSYLKKSVNKQIPGQMVVTQNEILVVDSVENRYISVIHTTTDVSWNEHREQFFKSYLNTRFDNNYWFASGNRYYRSANNDPTYFPITEYNDLGDSNEDITGFNLANDTTLLAYKQNRLYLIQPFSSALDTVEYSVTESKNTVGNTAINAPIVTTLTEIPLQINNDGIYGLSQLQNVSATERIADLMSEPINERWLNIDDELIKNAQTLNRLYWTYVIIPDNTHSRTMIYLLDNRSNSWYYWELPIVVADSFVKDNKAEFVDTQGAIYYLTATDIENKAFDTQLVTDYYDDGKKLISWYWQSQVLPMGTMNYSKRLVNTTFILTDTDTQDGYGLQYNFKVFRKLASSTPEKEISGDINLVRSTTKKTNISKFGFLQLKISNITEESQGTEAEKAFRNNKLRLVGLGLKYVLLEGLIR